MKIRDYDQTVGGDVVYISATVAWEESDRPPQRVHVGAEQADAEGLEPNPDAFLLGTIVTALHHGERRVHVEGSICPVLRDGLQTAMRLLGSWYGHDPAAVAIEPTQGFASRRPCNPRRAAAFFSGGVDGMATLRMNRCNVPPDHPGSISDAILVYGFDLGGYQGDDQLAGFAEARNRLRDFARSVGLRLVPVYTNLRSLDDSDQVFAYKSHGSLMAAIAHALADRFSEVLIPSSYNLLDLTPWGSHVLLDPNFRSSYLQVIHDGAGLTRHEKLQLVAAWDQALSCLRSCWQPTRPVGELNCGRCDKCLRTMLGLLACGKLAECTSFPLDDVTPEDLHDVDVYAATVAWRQLLGPLAAIGRDDLVATVRRKLRQHERATRTGLGARLRQAIRGLDRTVAAGRLRRFYHRWKARD